MDQIEVLVPENWRLLVHILLSPIRGILWLFEGDLPMQALKIILLLLPSLFFAIGVLASAVGIVTLLLRSNKNAFTASLLITWWDGGKSIFLYWVGLLKFLFIFLGHLGMALRLIFLGIASGIKEVLLLPMTIITQSVKNYGQPGIPWPSVVMTIFWIGVEAFTFSYILSPMASDIISGLTNSRPSDSMLMIGLFIFLFIIVGGSFACMHGLVDAIQKRDYFNVVKMLIVEIFVMFIEVLFFYREFVDSLAPWLAQMSNESIKLGLGSILGMAAMAWFGIRSTTWFFFAKYGTPTLLMVMSRQGLDSEFEGHDRQIEKKNGSADKSKNSPSGVPSILQSVQQDLEWFYKKGQELVHFFILPPIQLLAVIANFIMLVFTGKIIFNLPITNLEQLKDTQQMLAEILNEDKK